MYDGSAYKDKSVGYVKNDQHEIKLVLDKIVLEIRIKLRLYQDRIRLYQNSVDFILGLDKILSELS